MSALFSKALTYERMDRLKTLPQLFRFIIDGIPHKEALYELGFCTIVSTRRARSRLL